MTTTAMPTISVTATAASSTTWTTPTITPPSAKGNPNVWRSTAPAGTVFIAVGSVAGFLLLFLLMFIVVRKVIARRAAQKTLQLTDSSSSSFQQGGSTEKLMSQSAFASTSNLRKSISQGKIPLLYDTQRDNSLADLSDSYLKSNEALYSTLEKPENNRRSMFISPTAEVMNLTKSHNRVISSVSVVGSSADGSSYQPSARQNHHERNESYTNYTDTGLQSPERGANRAYKPRSKAVPSAYLDSMFGET